MKFLLAGYFGFGNFGDEAILKYAIDILRYYHKTSEISVLAQSPHNIKKQYGVNGLYRFDLNAIIYSIKNCDYLIFPGGSVLQDATSSKSIIYYLTLIAIALFFKKKVILLAQGIGPINNAWAQKITFKLLKQISLITLRDERSYNQLRENDINCELTADLLWAFTQNPFSKKEENNIIFGDISTNNQKRKIGIQLRNWKDLTQEKLEILAKGIIKNFPFFEFDYKLISLQKNGDEEVLIELGKIMHNISRQAKIELYTESDIEKNIGILQSMDYLIAMRFHAGLCAINAEKSLLMISYDPKTEELCNELGLKYIDVKNISQQSLKDAFAWLKEFNPARTALKTNILVKKSQQNVDFLVRVIK